MAWEVLFFIGFALVAAAIFGLGLYFKARRRKELQAWCTDNGWTYRGSGAWWREFDGFSPFGTGGSRGADHQIEGELDGQPFRTFEYHYTTGSGKNQTTHFWHITETSMPLEAPGLTVEPENVGHKIWDALGGEDIDFESDEFSRKYWVRCGDRRFAYDVLRPRVMEELLRGRDWHFQWRGNSFVVAAMGGFKEANVHKALQRAQALRGMLPRHRLAEAR